MEPYKSSLWSLLMSVPPSSLENIQPAWVSWYDVASLLIQQPTLLVYPAVTILTEEMDWLQTSSDMQSFPLLGALSALAPSHWWGDHVSQFAPFENIYQTDTYSCFTPRGTDLRWIWVSFRAFCLVGSVGDSDRPLHLCLMTQDLTKLMYYNISDITEAETYQRVFLKPYGRLKKKNHMNISKSCHWVWLIAHH